MSLPRPRIVAVGLVLASALAAWLRFDANAPFIAWVVVLVSLAGAVAGWLVNARRLPPIEVPPVVGELGERESLTPEEEARFAAELRSWHDRNQRAAWQEMVRQGPAAQIARWSVLLYLWLSLFAIALVPPRAVPDTVLPALPRSVVVLAPLAGAALAVGSVLGTRDRGRIRKRLRRPSGGA